MEILDVWKERKTLYIGKQQGNIYIGIDDWQDDVLGYSNLENKVKKDITCIAIQEGNLITFLNYISIKGKLVELNADNEKYIYKNLRSEKSKKREVKKSRQYLVNYGLVNE